MTQFLTSTHKFPAHRSDDEDDEARPEDDELRSEDEEADGYRSDDDYRLSIYVYVLAGVYILQNTTGGEYKRKVGEMVERK